MTVPTASRLSRYLVVILRWVFITGGVFALTFLTGVYIADNVLPKVYTATTQIQIRPRGLLNVGQLTEPQIVDLTNFQAEFEIMESPELLLPVINDLGLDKAWAKRIFKSQDDRLSDQDALAYMHKILKLAYMRGTNIIAITVSSDVPKEAADIANAIVDRYKVMRDLEEGQQTSHGEDSLRDQIAQQQKVVDEKKVAVEKMVHDLGLDRPHSGPSDIQAQTELDGRVKDLLAAQEDYDARRVLLDSVSKLPDDQFIATLNGLGQGPKNVSDPTHLPKEQITLLRRQMQIDTDRVKSRVDELQKKVDNQKANVRQEEKSQIVPFRDAQRQLQQQAALLDALNVRLKQVDADLQLQQSPVHILTRAEAPTLPTKPNRTRCLIVTIVGAGLLSVMAASFVEIILLFLRASERTSN